MVLGSSNFNWLVVLTTLKNISQWEELEGLSHILWKKTCSKPPTSQKSGKFFIQVSSEKVVHCIWDHLWLSVRARWSRLQGGTPQSHGLLFGPEMQWPQIGHPPWTNPWTPSVCWLSNSIYTPFHSSIPLFHTPWFIREIDQIFWRPHDGNIDS